MEEKSNVFIGLYVLNVLISVLNYKKTYGGSVFSIAGIIDNFVVTLLPAALLTGLILLIQRLYKRISKGKNKDDKDQ
jgi:hypothetical protein